MPESHRAAVETRGFIDVIHAEPDSSSAVVSGWALPQADEAVSRLEVSLGGEPLRVVETALSLESPDIAEAYPSYPLAGSARFHVRAAIEPRHLESGARSLVRVTPWVGSRRGHAIFGVHESAIPRPSEADVDVIGGGYATAFEFLSHFVERGGLEERHRVLDVGCGVGRMAIPLAFFLAPSATYRGFDIAEKGLAWAREVIGARFPNFEFTKVDVKNEAYNPAGRLGATEFAFPYPDRSFDFAFLTSVFTHLRGPETRHYLDELARVLDEGGRCLATAFLLDAESRAAIAAGRSSRNLVHPVGDGFTSDPELPENAIGFDEPLFMSWAAKSGLRLLSKHPGGWCGRNRFASYQDILVFATA
jgi:ubiquinone/menaquinone biosynthesis C-methylase UbiE